MTDSHPLYLGGKPASPNADLEVRDKYSGDLVACVARADEATIADAIGRAVAAEPALRAMPAHARQAVLLHCVQRFRERAEELAELLCAEAGKPIRDSRGEVGRLIDTFQIAAEEAVRIDGEVLAMDRSPRTTGYFGMWQRVPIGACSLISPFNFPLNLAAHKTAPAIAAGCPFVLKPASSTPLGALVIGEVLAETELPDGAFSVLPCRREGAALFTEDPRLKLLSFTGSPEVGWELKAKAGKKKVVLELGGNAGCIVDADTDIDDAVARIVFGAFYQSGQSCISVQRVVVHEDILDAFRTAFVAATGKLKVGNPRDEDVFIGPVISLGDAERLESWIAAARGRGARVLCGGARQGVMVEPTVLENVPPDAEICAAEAFGPVAVLSSFRDFDAALAEVNASRYGLQAGVFTRDIHRAMRAWDVLEVGGVVVNDVPSWRADHMPYGGVKDSGIGREGLRCAIEDMTEMRMLVLRRS